MYLKDDNGVVYWENPDQPSQAFTPEEWVIERERLLIGLQSQIDIIQTQIDNLPQLIDNSGYPEEVTALIDEHNQMIPSSEDLETEKQIKIDLKNHIENL